MTIQFQKCGDGGGTSIGEGALSCTSAELVTAVRSGGTGYAE